MDKKLALKELKTIISESKKSIICYFTGSKNEEGISWCPDCNDSAPVIDYLLNTYSDKFSYYSYYIDRPIWKDKDNEYRTDSFFKVTSVPTLIYYSDGVEMIRMMESEISKQAIDDLFI